MAILNITYGLFGGTNNVGNPASYESTTELPVTLLDPTKEGYTFVAWYDNGDFIGDPVTEIPLGTTTDEAVYAEFTINSYALQFTDHDDTVLQTADYEFGADTSGVTAPADPTRTGYVFNVWGSSVPATMPASVVTIQATYTAEQHTITFESNGGTAVTTLTQDTDSVVTQPIDPTFAGYTFVDWYNEVGLTTAYVFDTMKATDTIAYASWTVNQYTITFDSNGGTVVTAITQDFGTVVTEPADPTKAGLNFRVWSSDVELTQEYIFTTMPAENITVYGDWYAVLSYVPNGGSAVASENVGEGNTPVEPTDPTYAGYTFNGWYTDDITFSVPANFLTPLTADEVFYADWVAILYTAQYLDEDLAVLKTADFEFGADTSTFTPPADPTKTGWTFTAWDSTVPATMPVDGITITATYTINSVTMTFNTGVGSAVAPYIQDYGTPVVEPTTSETGYTFVGWFEEVEFTTPYVFDTMPAADLTIYAKLTENIYNITYLNVLGIVNSNPTTYESDTPVTFAVPTVTAGYTFAGWFDAAEGGNEVVETTTETIGSFTLYAQWDMINNYLALPVKSLEDRTTKVNVDYITRVGIVSSGVTYYVLVTVDGVLNYPKDYILFTGYGTEAEALVARDTFLASY